MMTTIRIRLAILERIGDITAYGGLVFCILVFSATSGGRLWSNYNIGLLLESACVYSIIALGAIFVYSMGCMDISVGPQLGVYCILMILIVNVTGALLPAFLTVLVLTLLCGAFNGAVAVFLKLPSIVTSLFLMFIFGGLQIIMMEKTGVNTISVIPQGAKAAFRMLMNPIIIFAAVTGTALIVFYLFNFTKLGRYVRSIGANEVVAAQCGINTTKWKVIAYMAYGVCVALGALFMLARTGSAGKGTGSGYAMDIMLSLILGGMPLSGGMRARARSAIIGSFTYVLLSNGLILSNVNLTQVNLIKALIFLGVIVITCRDRSGFLPR
jgi:ribose transport system permease protein